jgi:alcohol dehydrogenase YqhD (iron-dependent ADH family)
VTLDDKDVVVEAAIDRLEAFYRGLGLPVRLSDAGIGNERVKTMASNAMINRDHIGSFKELKADDVEKILKLAL